MSKVGTKQQRFQEIALAHIRGEIDIDAMRELYESEDFWTEEEKARADREWKNAGLRRFARKPVVDEDGNRREMVNIKRAGTASSEKQQFFMWLDETTQKDFEWVIEDRMEKRNYFDSEVSRLLTVYAERFGRKAARLLQRRLQFEPAK